MVENIVGKRFESKNCNEFVVLRKSKEKRGTAVLFEVEFNKVNGVAYRTLALKHNILSGQVKNRYYSSVYGVGFLGDAKTKKGDIIYIRWRAMLSRCYNLKDINYHNYGGNGVIVCERWHNFTNFLNDFPLLDGYDKNNLHKLQLDKDIRVPNNKVYNLENCILISQTENNAEKIKRNNKKFLATSPTGEIFKSHNQREFARQHDLKQGYISQVLLGRMKHYKGWKFEYIE